MASTESETKLGPNASRIKDICPALLDVLKHGSPTLLKVLDSDDDDDDENDTLESSSIPFYWHRVHLMFIFQTLVSCTLTELSVAIMNSHRDDRRAIEELPYSKVTPSQLSARLELFQSLLESIEASLKNYEETSNISTVNSSVVPMAQMAEAYQLKPYEIRTLQFLVTLKVQPSPCVLDLVMPRASPDDYMDGNYIPTSGGDEKMAYSSITIRYACGVTALEWANLANEDHPLCRDRVLILVMEEYSNASKLTVSEEACRALMGWPLKSEDKLKLSATKLLKLIDGSGNGDITENTDENLQRYTSESGWSKARNTNESGTGGGGGGGGGGDEAGSGGDTMAEILGRLSLRNMNGNLEALVAPREEEAEPVVDIPKSDDNIDTDNDNEEENVPKNDEEEDRTKPQAYKNELEYLSQFFEIVMHKVLLSKRKTAQDIRSAALSGNKPSWMRTGAENPSNNRSVGEISAKIKLGRRKMQLSLELTRKEGGFYPRLELLAEQLQLDDFEKFVLVYLAGSMISPIFSSAVFEDTYDKATKVGHLLVSYFDSFSDQVKNRPYFYRSSTLLRKGLIQFVNQYRMTNDLTDQEIKLDRRVLDCVVGLDKESSEVSHGSHLYDPKISLDAVVLPDKLKEMITGAVTHFEQFRTYRKHNPGFDEAIAYGVGLTLMFCGKSGTGKTMTANAIAAKLKKKLLLVNFPALQQQNHESRETPMYQSIFREAELSDAIIFFDECESLFSKRGSGGSSETTELLTALERFEGIVFLATNRPYDLDEAMYRRISEVFEFKAPNYLERLQIWKLVTSHKAIPCDESIDWETIALQYELTGGFIKNAVISALMDAVGRDPHSPVISQPDILNGCKKQVRGALQMVEFNERVIPRGGLSDLVASDTVMEQIKEMVNLEKARSVLVGTWGLERSRQGTTALFWGQSGTGRSRAAEAIGFELGKPLKVVDLPRLLLDQKGSASEGSNEGGGKAIRSVFYEARLMDAVLVLDGFSLEIEGGGGGGAPTDSHLLNLVMREMTRFPGVVIMMVDTTGSLDVFISRIDKSLIKSLKFLVEFQLPTPSKRQILWQKLIPSTLPVVKDIDHKRLAEASHDFSVAHIGNAIYRAAASAVLRTNTEERRVSMKDLYQAIEEEKTRGESAVDRWMKAQYI
ncbi:hypothetical protein ACA910_021349 [Epithemia clementina (nom. ined.)]